MKINPILFFSTNSHNIKQENRVFNKTQTSPISDVPNFYVPTIINFRGNGSFQEQLREKIEDSDKEDLALFLYDGLNKRTAEKKINPRMAPDVVQNGILQILILIDDYEKNNKEKDWLLDEINKIYINLKPGNDDYTSLYRVSSLDKKTKVKEKPLIETLTEENAIIPLSRANDEDRGAQRKKIEQALDITGLSKKERGVLEKRYSKDKLVSYDSIANDYGFSGSYILEILKRTMFKIQVANGTLDKKTKDYIEDFSKTFNLDTQTVQDVLVKRITIMDKAPSKRRENIEKLVWRFEDEGLTTEDYIKACVKKPQLFYQLPDTVENNVRDLVKRFEKEGLTTKDYIEACLKQPQLFTQSPDTIEGNIKGLVEKFKDEGLTTKDYLKACLKQPQTFYRLPDSIEGNVRDLVKRFENEGLTTKDYLKACLKQPQLFSQSPDTVENKIRNLTKRFENEGLTTKDYVKAALVMPSLFCQTPDTIEDNVRSLVYKFKDEGLNTKDYIKACLKRPQLFYQSPVTIEGNVRDLVKRFEDEGLTTKDYLKVCLKQPQLFCQLPQTVEKNVRGVVKRFEDKGLNAKEYIKACIKQPPLFQQSPDTISEHIDTLKFSDENSKNPSGNKEFWEDKFINPMHLCFSSSYILTRYLIIPKMFEGEKIPKELKKNKPKEKLNDYLKSHPETHFVLNIKPIKTNTDCFKILNETIKSIEENVGRDNIFEINIQR